jgi:KAP family P-loop domain
VWSDNETNIDLLGFDYLVDALELVLTDPGMLPVTIGVVGDWGSGKSSVLQMAESRLRATPEVITVSFSPWRFEGYDDMKAALMSAVICRDGATGRRRSLRKGTSDRGVVARGTCGGC